MIATDFAIGLRVMCISVPDGNKAVVGDTGTVIGYHADWVAVRFDHAHNLGHTCAGRCEGGRGYNCPPDTLRPLCEDANPSITFDQIITN